MPRTCCDRQWLIACLLAVPCLHSCQLHIPGSYHVTTHWGASPFVNMATRCYEWQHRTLPYDLLSDMKPKSTDQELISPKSLCTQWHFQCHYSNRIISHTSLRQCIKPWACVWVSYCGIGWVVSVVLMAPKKDIPVQACCNPFNDHTKRIKGLRPISRVFTDKYPSAGLRVGNKLCGMCRKRIIAQSTRNSPEAQDVAGPSTAVEDVEFEDDPVSTLNETLSPLGISPFKKQRLQRSKHYAKGKVKRVGTAIKRKLETMEIEVGSTSSSDETAESEIVQQQRRVRKYKFSQFYQKVGQGKQLLRNFVPLITWWGEQRNWPEKREYWQHQTQRHRGEHWVIKQWNLWNNGIGLMK